MNPELHSWAAEAKADTYYLQSELPERQAEPHYSHSFTRWFDPVNTE